MGRLFWKLLFFIWLGQMAAVFGAGALFWLERHEHWSMPGERRPPPMEGSGFHHDEMRPHRPPPPRPGLDLGVPLVPVVSGVLASLLCAAGLAWYFAKPIRQLRNGLHAAEEGDLSVRLADGMGGRRDELADLGRDFDRMTERLQAAMDGQQRLMHDVSHEMRSPIARLQAAIGLARQQPARLEDSLLRIEREGERMNRLVGELLTLSRLDAGELGARERVDVDELMAGVVEDASFEGAARQIGIDYAVDAPTEVTANPELLRRAVENVVRNAIRHSPDGGLIRVFVQGLPSEFFEIVVEDQGPGVALDVLPRLFDPFFRGAGHGEGYGLGLAIAQRVIAALGGQIMAANIPAAGLRVVIRLPLASSA